MDKSDNLKLNFKLVSSEETQNIEGIPLSNSFDSNKLNEALLNTFLKQDYKLPEGLPSFEEELKKSDLERDIGKLKTASEKLNNLEDLNWWEKSLEYQKVVSEGIVDNSLRISADSIDIARSYVQVSQNFLSDTSNTFQKLTGSNILNFSTTRQITQVLTNSMTELSSTFRMSSKELKDSLFSEALPGIFLKNFRETQYKNSQLFETLPETFLKTFQKTQYLSSKKTYTSNSDRALREIIRSQDAQLQNFIAYFSIETDKGETPLELETPTKGNKYFYYFYTNGFEINPVRKNSVSFSYGAYKTSFSLNQPDSNTEFSFSLPLDIELSFWKFISEKGLSVNLEKSIFSTENNYDKKVNLNFILVEAPFSDSDEVLVNKFTLENVKFFQTSSLAFQHSFGSTPLQNNIKGVYRRLKWHHNLKLD